MYTMSSLQDPPACRPTVDTKNSGVLQRYRPYEDREIAPTLEQLFTIDFFTVLTQRRLVHLSFGVT